MNKDIILMNNDNIISSYLYDIEEIGKNLEKNKGSYENKKTKIEEDIKRI